MKLFLRVVLLFTFIISGKLNAQISESRIASMLSENTETYKLENADLDNIVITDNYTSKGVNHVYFKQTIQGRPIYDSYGAIHEKKSRLFFDETGVIKGLKNWKIESSQFQSFSESFGKLVLEKNYRKDYKIVREKSSNKELQAHEEKYIVDKISNSPVITKEVYYTSRKGQLKTGRIIIIDEVRSNDYLEILLD